MSTDSLVSIVMPAFNASRFIAAAIESVLSQTYPHWELLVVEDCSSDNTLEIARNYANKDDRIRIFPQSRNQGVTAARNHALSNARGKYIAFLDSDDLWEPEKLSLQVAFMQSNGISICYSGYQRIDQNGAKLAQVMPPLQTDYRGLLKGNVIGNLTGIYDAESLGKENFKPYKHEDYVAWLALIKRAGKAVGLAQPLASYRVYEGSVSSNKIRTLGWQWRIYRECEQLNRLHSTWLMLNYMTRAVGKRLG
jgi:glycosyltransferase involved in cell wall biosynthesis